MTSPEQSANDRAIAAWSTVWYGYGKGYARPNKEQMRQPVIWQDRGTHDGIPWSVSLNRTMMDGMYLAIRDENTGATDTFTVFPVLPETKVPFYRDEGRAEPVQIDDVIKVVVQPSHPYKRPDDDKYLNNPELIAAVAGHLVEKHRPILIEAMLEEYGFIASGTIRYFADEHQKLVELKELREGCLSRIEALQAQLPEETKTRIEALSLEDKVGCGWIDFDTPLGVLRMKEEPDGHSVHVTPSKKASSLPSAGSLEGDRYRAAQVPFRGRLIGAHYIGCDPRAGDRMLIKAVHSFRKAHPEALVLVQIAKEADSALSAESQIHYNFDVAVRNYEKYKDISLEKHEAMLAFARSRDDIDPPEFPLYPTFDFSGIVERSEEEPAPLVETGPSMR